MANKVSKYLKNLDKETTQAGNAGETLKKKKGTPKEKAAASKLRNERGQMFGALLQGRRYDENGKQITKSSSKKPAPAKPKAPVAPSKGTKKIMPKTGPSGKKKNMPLTGPAAVEAIQRRTSPAGVKKAEMDAKKATKKKYPGLYKK